MTTTPNSHDAESRIRKAYEQGAIYDTARICWKLNSLGTDFVDRLLQLRFELVGKYYQGGRLVDLCCASGVHLTDFAANVDRAVGIDFSGRYLAAARALAAEKKLRNVTLVQADARRLPLAAGSVNFLYSFSSLYAIPKAAEAIEDIGRVLAPGGHAILDLGNRRSLNAICVRYYTDWPPIHPLTLGEIRHALKRASLQVVEHRRFQVLPLWADRPSWLWPLLHPAWKRLLQRQVAGRMLDEWVSSLPILRAFAFRHLIVCQKVAVPR